MLSARIARLEREKSFREWLAVERLLEGFTDRQLELYAFHGQLPDPLPVPLPEGASRFDRMSRTDLMKMWEAHEREFGNRTKEELNFYAIHGHWPDDLPTNVTPNETKTLESIAAPSKDLGLTQGGAKE